MIFDRLAGFADRFPDRFRGLRDILARAHVFHFDYAPHEVLPKSYTREELNFHAEHFVLPFPVVAIEDRSSCVLMWDADPDAQGLGCERYFVEAAPLAMQCARSWRDAEEEEEWRKSLSPAMRARIESMVQYSVGVIHSIDPSRDPSDAALSSWLDITAAAMLDVQVATKTDFCHEETARLQSEPSVLRGTVIPNAMTAIEELMQLNTPDRFILRTSPAVAVKGGRKKTLRSHERPIYTLLKPDEIRARMQTPGDGAPRRLHERRRHVRRYPDDPTRWPNVHGKAVVIPACWSGTAEATVGRRHYKVMLDL
tara:strand:- start:11032 stop:11964 length:933 start_codon:yes stop_codon:yes gene_type:complete